MLRVHTSALVILVIRIIIIGYEGEIFNSAVNRSNLNVNFCSQIFKFSHALVISQQLTIDHWFAP